MGNIEDMDIDLTDFKNDTVDNNLTLSQLIGVAQMNKLRFYLTTKHKTIDFNSSDSNLPDLPFSGTEVVEPAKRVVEAQSANVSILDTTCSSDRSRNESVAAIIHKSSHSIPQNSSAEMSVDQHCDKVDETICFGRCQSTPKGSLDDTIPITSTNTNKEPVQLSLSTPLLTAMPLEALEDDILAQSLHMSNVTESFEEMDESDRDFHNFLEQYSSHPEASVDQQQPVIHSELTLHRGQVLKELITFAKQHNILGMILEVKMVMPNGEVEAGEDNGGILRDALSEFWDSFCQSCTTGEDIRVPCIVPSMVHDDWVAVAKVIIFGYTVQITFIFIDFRVCDFAFAFKTQNAPCVSRFKRVLFSDRFQFAS